MKTFHGRNQSLFVLFEEFLTPSLHYSHDQGLGRFRVEGQEGSQSPGLPVDIHLMLQQRPDRGQVSPDSAVDELSVHPRGLRGEVIAKQMPPQFGGRETPDMSDQARR